MAGRTSLRRELFNRPKRSSDLLAFNQWLQYFTHNGMTYGLPQMTLAGSSGEVEVPPTFEGLTTGAYQTNSVVFSCMMVRQMLFSEARFIFQRMDGGVPGDLFGSKLLEPLESPEPNKTTRDLLGRAIQDVDLAGNFYGWYQRDPRKRIRAIRRLRPDWTTIIAGTQVEGSENPLWEADAEIIGYQYHPGGIGRSKPQSFLVEDIVHWAPYPDPLARFRGMSWLVPLLREVAADGAATDHKLAFFQNGATSNMVVSLDPQITPEDFKEWVEVFEDEHGGGVLNAYKTIYFGGGANVEVVGSNFRQMDFKVTQGAGEPLALTTPVPTPDGWTTMGDIQTGDYVFGRDHRPVRVLGVGPIHTGRDCYRVTFSDRTSIVADADHIWTAMDRNTDARAELEYTTVQLRDLIDDWRQRGHGGNRIGIPAGRPVDLPACDLLIDPYVLGVWLGDGDTAGAAICGADPDLTFIGDEIERRGYTVRRRRDYEGRTPVIGLPGGLLAALADIGVLGDKHIPDEYLRASMAQRLDLLRGLMDSDGTVGHVGKETCEFSSKMEHLARQTAELARSLGYRVTVSRRDSAASRTGEHWRVTFRADPDIVPFLLPRKADRCQTPVWVKNRAIVSIEPVDSVPVRCIAVDSPDHLFRAGDGWTLTHNTRIAAAAGVPAVLVGLSEGLESATYSNYQQARRRLADGTMSSLWGGISEAFDTIIPPPPGGPARLWYDKRGIPFLREDEKDVAEIRLVDAQALEALVRAGYTPESAQAAVVANDLKLLKHSGLVSVQLLPPGQANGNGAGAQAQLPAAGGSAQ